MRESIGATSIFALCITFIMLFTAYLAISVNYSKAFRIKSHVISMIEENGGHVNSLSDEIKTYLISESYTADKKCPSQASLTDEATNSVGDNWELAYAENFYTGGVFNPVNDRSNICIYKMEVSNDANNEIDANKVYYKVITFFKFDLPVIGNITTFNISGDTKLLYEN